MVQYFMIQMIVDALFGPNPTWGAYLLVGGNGREGYVDSSFASVATTNGNLHLDSGNGYATYINYYDGSVIYFGNGAYTNWGEFSSGIFYAYNQMRSPIMYDYNDTGYYVDPNATTNIRYLKVNTTGTSSATRALTIKQDGFGEYNYGSYPGAWTSALQIQNNDNTKMIWISPLDSSNWANFRVNGSTAGLHFNMGGSINNNGTTSFEIYSSYVYSGYPVYGTIFYDANNSARYVDPNGESRLNGTRFYPTLGTGRGSYSESLANIILEATSATPSGYANIEFLSNYNTPSDGAAITYYTGIDGGEASQLRIRLNNDFNDGIALWGGYIDFNCQTVDGLSQGYRNPIFRWQRYGNEIMGLNSSAELSVQGDVRAPIFYDLNNTGYFANPAGRSRLSEIDYGDGGYYFRGGSWGWRHQTPSGYIEFGPANTGHAHIYTDRSNFYFNVNELYANGYHVIVHNLWWGNTYFGSGGDMYATIWYDTNDTGYRLDPNGSSRLNFVHTNNLLKYNGIVRTCISKTNLLDTLYSELIVVRKEHILIEVVTFG